MWRILIISLTLCFFKKSLLARILFIFSIIKIIRLFKLYEGKIKFLFYIDKISLIMIFLSLIIIRISFLLRKNKKLTYLKLFLQIFFSSQNIIRFYLFFELRIIPAFFLIYKNGLNPERLRALQDLVLYTIIGSLPLAYTIFSWKRKIFFLQNLFLKKDFYIESFIIVLFFILAFLIKLPLFGLHFWLPKAHVEAPTIGSMILAALLLKMGRYGLMRFSIKIYSFHLRNFLVSWVIFFLLIVRFFCFRIEDIKKLIAFSSVNHMLLVAFSWTLFTKNSLNFSLLLKLGHGFIRRGLFLIIGTVYNKSFSRNILMNSGLKHFFNILIIFWFSLLMANCSAPTSLSLYSEIFLFSHLALKKFSLIRIILFVFFSGLYCIFLYIKMFHGLKKTSINIKTPDQKTILIRFIHFFYTFVFIFFIKKIF